MTQARKVLRASTKDQRALKKANTLRQSSKKSKGPKVQVRKNGVAVKNPTTRRGWKLVEQKVAEFFGTRRNPLSGSNSGHTGSDSLHRHLYIEVKMRAKLPVYDLYLETAEGAKKEGKIPIVVLKKKNAQGFLLLLEAKNLKQISDYVRD